MRLALSGIACLLFVPASRPERFEKACAASPEGIVIDLEDAVPPADKCTAREAVIAFLRQERPGRPVLVRINPLSTRAGLDDLAQGHLLAAGALEAGEDAGAQGELGIKILLSEAVVVKLELLGTHVAEALGGVANAQRVDVGAVVATGLVRAHKQLDLEVVREISALADADASASSQSHDALLAARHQTGGRGEGLGDGHVAALHVLEIHLPRHMHAAGVLTPLQVHLVNVVSCATRQEAVVRVGRVVESAFEAFLRHDAQWTAGGRQTAASTSPGSRGSSREASRGRDAL